MERRTVGLSPKVTIPTSVLAIAGAALAVVDAIGWLTIDDSLWLGLLAAGGVTGVTGFAADPGEVKSQRGLALIEALLAVFIILVILVVLLRLI